MIYQLLCFWCFKTTELCSCVSTYSPDIICLLEVKPKSFSCCFSSRVLVVWTNNPGIIDKANLDAPLGKSDHCSGNNYAKCLIDGKQINCFEL